MNDGARLGNEFSTAVVMFHEAIGQRLGLTAADHKALGLIQRHGPLSAGTLARLTGLTPGAVTGLVDRLEGDGHVERVRDPEDRRRTLVRTHETSDMTEIFVELQREVAAFSRDYTEDDWRAIVDYLTNMIEVLKVRTERLSTLEGGADEPPSGG